MEVQDPWALPDDGALTTMLQKWYNASQEVYMPKVS